MGWGESHICGAGTVGEIAEAHTAFDELHIRSGSLAVRAKEAARIIARYEIVIDVSPSLTRSGVTYENPVDLIEEVKKEISKRNTIPDIELIEGDKNGTE